VCDLCVRGGATKDKLFSTGAKRFLKPPDWVKDEHYDHTAMTSLLREVKTFFVE